METFDLESHLQDAYSRFPEAKHQPVIGLTANYEGIDATLRDRYYKQVIAAGGTPVIIPPVADAQVIVNTLEHLDGLILTGGGDHNPLWMGEEPSPRLHNINQERDLHILCQRIVFSDSRENLVELGAVELTRGSTAQIDGFDSFIASESGFCRAHLHLPAESISVIIP